MERLQQIYDDAGRPGVQAFRFAVRRAGGTISEVEAKAFVAKQSTGQIFAGRVPSDGKISGGGREDMRWQIDLIVFSIAGVVLVVMGRTVFSGLREAKTDRPNLNQRGKSLIGKRAVVVDDFVAGEGRVRIGDTTWMAVAPADVAVTAGMEVTVQDVDSTVLKITV